jgi:hypothetical protein
MNFVIASAMLMTPLLVKSLYTKGLTSMAGPIGAMAGGAIVAGPSWVGKAAVAEKTSRAALGSASSFIGSSFKSSRSQE